MLLAISLRMQAVFLSSSGSENWKCLEFWLAKTTIAIHRQRRPRPDGSSSRLDWVVLGLALVPLAGVLPVSADPRPNIILVLTDDQGYGDLGVHGNARISTPNLDAFARESLEMTRFYVEPVCSPTRSSIMTGRYHMRTGVLATSRGGARMFGDEETLAEVLAQSGYRTTIAGKWHLGDNAPSRPQDQGFQQVLVHRSGGIGQIPDRDATYTQPLLWRNGKREVGDGYCTDLFFDAAIDFIKNNRTHPFFLYLPTNVPHTPISIAKKYWQPFADAGVPEQTAKLYGMMKNLDDNFGRLTNALTETGLARNSVLIFMSDNGPTPGRFNSGLRGSKGSVYEGGIRVPFLVRWPQRISAGSRVDRLAAHIDLLPTLAAAAGARLSTPGRLDGVNLLKLWTGEIQPAAWPARNIYIQTVKRILQKRYLNAAVLTQRYKWVSYAGVGKIDDLDRSKIELYDLNSDPGESQNLAARFPHVLNNLSMAYEAWFDEMKRERNFAIGPIDLGSALENPCYLCRYQDAQNLTGQSQHDGWQVRVRRTGRYRLTLQWPEHKGGFLVVTWRGKRSRHTLGKNDRSAIIELKAGQGLLDVGFETPTGQRVRQLWNNQTEQGDVWVERVD